MVDAAPATGEFLVDPAVSRAKFERELALYRELEDEHIRRGFWLVRASFPEVFVVFGVPHLTPPAVAFAATLDFTNYDLWPPAVRLVDPFTRVPYKASELPTPLPQRADTPQVFTEALQQLAAAGIQLEVPPFSQNLMQVYGDDVPFVCMRGVREYHQHPGHSGDAWLRYRGSGYGTLNYILEQLHKYGVAPLQYRTELVVRIAGFAPREIPA